MDPNLTLAHVTHNTSMILLHQRIAYPDVRWASTLRLPNLSSAEVCQTAAVETCSITQRYLKHTAEFNFIATQYAFCVFISARVLLGESLKLSFLISGANMPALVHWRHYETDLAREFWILVHGLDEMAKRWAGPSLRHRASQSQAGRYAEQLRQLQSRCEADPQVKIDVLGYTSGTVQGSVLHPTLPRSTNMTFGGSGRPVSISNDNREDMQLNLQFPEATSALSATRALRSGDADSGPGQSDHSGAIDSQQDNLSAMSHLLMDEDFLVMDRIISLDDEIFAIPENDAYLGTNFHGLK